MWQSQHCFGTVVPWQTPKFAFLSQPCPHPGSVLRSCFVAWSAHPPATSACFTVLCGQTHAAFSLTSDTLLMALMECSAFQHTSPSRCLAWKSGIPHTATCLLTMSQGEGAGWLPLCSSKATLGVVARAKAPLESCIPPTASKVVLRLS